ncbi:MAG: Holo-[acyl-carrier-protein] synthase, partial [uncultured Rubrobacteraceae bacterium]
GKLRGAGYRSGRRGRRADAVRPREDAKDTPETFYRSGDLLLREVPLRRTPLRRPLGRQRGRHEGPRLRPDPVERCRGDAPPPTGPDGAHLRQDRAVREDSRRARGRAPHLYHPLRALGGRCLRRAKGRSLL